MFGHICHVNLLYCITRERFVFELRNITRERFGPLNPYWMVLSMVIRPKSLSGGENVFSFLVPEFMFDI